MHLKSFEYSELADTPRAWSVSKFQLENLNLFVGRNASGKTRLLNCIAALSSLLQRKPDKLFESGDWKVCFEHKGQTFRYNLTLKDRTVARETLELDGRKLLERRANGTGKIWFERLSQFVELDIPTDSVAAFHRRDKKQHPFLEPLAAWSSSVRFYPFGSEFGRQVIFAAPIDETQITASESSGQSTPDPHQVVQQYVRGWLKFQKPFDDAILRDFKAVGYDCEIVEAVHAREFSDAMPFIVDKIPVGLQVKERDLPGPTRQFDMSMGMYRTLALLIHVNYIVSAKEGTTILIDDIGEGLDFERSTALIKQLIKKCNKNIQLIMTSNDRFVMNEVDLKYWHIVNRTSSSVRILDYGTSKEVFDKFKRVGLSNFDFFAKGAYAG